VASSVASQQAAAVGRHAASAAGGEPSGTAWLEHGSEQASQPRTCSVARRARGVSWPFVMGRWTLAGSSFRTWPRHSVEWSWRRCSTRW
jgi:hypothetical protein